MSNSRGDVTLLSHGAVTGHRLHAGRQAQLFVAAVAERGLSDSSGGCGCDGIGDVFNTCFGVSLIPN